MSKCRCGCGEDVEEGKQFLKGHWSKLNAQKKAEEPKPEEPKQPEEPKITFGDFRQILQKSENVAWFKTAEGYIFKNIEFYCTVRNETTGEQSDYVAVVLEDASIMPAILLPGFAGIFPKDHELIIEPEEPKTEEKEPIPTEKPIVKILPPQENPPISQPNEPINDAIEELRKISNLPKPEKKKGFIARMLGGDSTREDINASGYAGR